MWLRERLGQSRGVALYLLQGLPLLVLSVVSVQCLAVWRDSQVLWSDAVAKEPAGDKAWEHYAEALRVSGQVNAARKAYERGLKLDPANTQILAGLARLSRLREASG